jgi:hypothetical protein
MDQQKTTVLIAGGFHTPGITRLLKEAGYSYVVITPQIKTYSPMDQHLYVQRLLGYAIPLSKKDLNAPLITFASGSKVRSRPKSGKPASLNSDLRSKLSRTPFAIPPVRDIFTAMDQPLPSSVKISLIKQRAEMLESARQVAFSR